MTCFNGARGPYSWEKPGMCAPCRAAFDEFWRPSRDARVEPLYRFQAANPCEREAA